MSLSKITTRFSRTLLSQCRHSVLLFGRHDSKQFQSFSAPSLGLNDRVVSGRVSLLHHSALNSSAFQWFGFSSSASQPNQKETAQSGHGSKEPNEHEARSGNEDENKESSNSISDETLDETEESNFDGKTESDMESDLSRDDLVKLVLEKEQLLLTKKMKDKVLRTLAEMENVKELTRRESEISKKFAIQNFAKSLLDVADNLGRASPTAKESFEKIDTSKGAAGAVKQLKTLLEGVEMTEKQLSEIEKSKAVQSNGRYVSTWPHFQSHDSLIGDSFSKTNNSNAVNGHNRNLRRTASPSPERSPSPEMATPYRKISPAPEKDPDTSNLLSLPWSVPVGPRSKRSGPGSVTESFSVMAAAAAAMEAEEDEDDYDDENEDCGAWGRWRLPAVGRKRKGAVEEEVNVVGEGYRRLAEAITRLGRIYEKVEGAMQRQMVELEKQRMQFAKDLEIQRMKAFMESQVQLEKLKRAKCNSENNKF